MKKTEIINHDGENNLQLDSEAPVFKTVTQFVKSNPAFTEGGLRHFIFFKGAEAETAGAIVRYGRKILINEHKFLALVQNGGARNISGQGEEL
jgi:hypothetical protein